MIGVPVCATCGIDAVDVDRRGEPIFPSGHEHERLDGLERAHPRYIEALGHPTGAPPRVGNVDESDGRIVDELDPDDMALGASCGALRLKDSKRRKLRDRLGEDAEWKHVTGAQGEIAFARWLGVPWECTTGAFGKADVDGCQVKTRRKTSYELAVHDNDAGRTPCVLITAHPPRFWIRGWILARDAKRPEWRKAVVGDWEGFFVPNDELRPMAEFLTSNAVRAARGLAPLGHDDA